MDRNKLELLVGKLRYMHLAVTRAVEHLYHIQRAFTQGGEDSSWLLADFHQEIGDWIALVVQTVARPTNLAEIFR